MRSHALSVLICGFATTLASRWDGMKVKHAWDIVPKNWESLGHPSNQTTIDLHLALKSRREEALVEALYEVSDPGHSRYGAHLSKEQVAEVIAPHPDTLELISSWLRHYDIPSSSISMTLGGNWLRVVGVSVSQANRILGASYQLYQHIETNEMVVRTIGYSLPEVLHGHIQTIVPTTHFGSPLTEAMRPRMHLSMGDEARKKAGSVLSSRDEDGITPSYLRLLYKTSSYAPKASDRNALGIAGYEGQCPSPQDLTLFMNEYSHRWKRRDIHCDADDPYIRWLRYMIAQDDVDIPRTISTSYGGYEHALPQEFAVSVCTLFAQLGVRGVSVLFASGDDGVGDGDCLVQSSSGDVSVQFLPVFPATCMWYFHFFWPVRGLLALVARRATTPEVAASLSGGGFSIYFLRQTYQADAIYTFLQNLGDKHSGLYSPLGRGYPDISSQAVKLFMVLGGQIGHTSGTSGSAPTVAGIISLLNDYLISKGSTPLGFLNPWLYGTGLPGLNDITSGSNPGCNTDGFPAVAGWDPVTGLGTLDFTKLEEIIDDRLRTSGTSSTQNRPST
ncbi:subtilisin-like protein [Lactarius sanguifluus]|nr:subtilisin-like protein [Lactarius sanguifluus]